MGFMADKKTKSSVMVRFYRMLARVDKIIDLYFFENIIFSDCLSSPDRVLRLSGELEESYGEISVKSSD